MAAAAALAVAWLGSSGGPTGACPAGTDWLGLGPARLVLSRLGSSRLWPGWGPNCGPDEAQMALAGLGPVVYSSADDLPVEIQWFSSGFLQWFIRVSMVFWRTPVYFFKGTNF